MNIKRLLLGLTLLTAFITGCEKVEDPDPLVVTPTGPQASFTFNTGTTYPGRPGYSEFLYQDNPVIKFENTSTRATSYLWNFGDGKINKTADSLSTEMSPSHSYPKVGLYIVTLTATLTENGQTRTSTISRAVNITYSRKKLLGKYAMIDTLSKVNKSSEDSMTVGTKTSPARAFARNYELTVTLNSSDSVSVDVANLGNLIKLKTAALVDTSASGKGFGFKMENMKVNATDSIIDISGRILPNVVTLPNNTSVTSPGSNLRLKYKIKNYVTNKVITVEGTGKRF